MDQDHNIRLKLQATMEGKNTVEEQLRAILAIEKQLTEQNLEMARATKARAAAAEAAVTREKALLQGVLGIQGELSEANRRSEEAAKRAAEAAKARAEANKREAEREKGILESLKAKYAELEKAKQRAMSFKEIREYNRQLSQLEQQINRASGETRTLSTTTGDLNGQFRTLQGFASAAFSTIALTQFATKLKEVTSNSESFAISLQTMLQSKEAADKLNAQVIDLAKRTPFTLTEVQEQTNKLLAYGIAAGDITKTITELGNIAAGVGREKLPFLTLAYGQVRTLGRLTGQEVRQFTEAGVPLLELLAKQSGKTTAQIQKDVSDGAVSFDMVKIAIASTSVEGGKFFNLMEKQSTTIQGRLSNFSDNVDQGLVRVGNQFKTTGLSVVSSLADWVEGLIGSDSAVTRSLGYVKTLISAYLSYRATLLAVTIQSRLKMAADEGLVGTQRLLVVATGQLDTAQKGLWATLRANPIGLIVAAVGLAVTAYQAWKAASTDVTTALGEEEAKIRTERDSLFSLVAAIRDTNTSNESRTLLIRKLKAEYPDLLKGLNSERITNQALDAALRGVNTQYTERIRLARLAYVTEQNQTKRKGIFEKELEAIETLKKADANFKPVSLDLGGVIREAEVFLKKNPTGQVAAVMRVGIDAAKRRLQELETQIKQVDKVETQAAIDQSKIQADLEKQQQAQHAANMRRRDELKKKIEGAKSKVSIGDYQELRVIESQIKTYEAAHNQEIVLDTTKDKAKKKWHDDELTRRLAEIKLMDESLAKEQLIINAEERIAVSKARFEEKTEAEIDLIRAEYQEKRVKAYQKYRDERKKLTDDLLEHEKEIKDKILEQQKKQLLEQRKLDTEYQKLLFEQARVREEIGLEQARERELREASTLAQRLGIEKKYDGLIATVRINSLQQQIFRENLRVQHQKKVGTLTENEARESRNKILKLENEIDQERERLAGKETDRQKSAAERRRQLERETNQMVIQLLGQSENAYVKGFASMLVAYQQYLDAKEKMGEGEARIQDKIILGLSAMGAASSAYFAAEKQRYEALAEAAAQRNAAEIEALEKRNQSDLENFVGNEEQKKQLQAKQDREKKALQAKQRKEEADLKLKAWKADKAAAISQTITSGLIAGVQAYVAAKGDPIRGSIYAAIIGSLTAIAVAQIARQKPPKFYRKGTEFVDDKREHPVGIDTVPAMLTRGESVLTVEQNKRKQELGLTNEGLLEGMEQRTAWQKQLAQMRESYATNPIAIQPVVARHHFTLEGKTYNQIHNQNKRVEDLLTEVSRKLNKLDHLTKTQININKQGFKIYQDEVNRRIEFAQNQYLKK